MPNQIATAKPDKQSPLILDLLERFFEDVPVVLPPAQTEAEKLAALRKARARRHWRGLRNIGNMLMGGFNSTGKAPKLIKYPRYEWAYVNGKTIVFGVRQEESVA